MQLYRGKTTHNPDSKKVKELFRTFPVAKFTDMLNSTTGNPEVEEDGDYFQWKKAYDIWEKESLRKFMLDQGEYGIQDGEKLEMCYKGVLEDIEELVNEGWIRVVKVTENARGTIKETRVFFPKDLTNKEVEFTNDELPDNCQRFLSDMWQKMGDNTQVKWEETLFDTPDLLCDQEREILSTRQVKN